MATKAPHSKEVFEYVTTQLLRQVAHDIRSPAGVVHNALEELTHDDTPEHRDQMKQMAQRGVRRLLRLADRLSMVAELQRDDVSCTREKVDVRTIVTRATDHAASLQSRRTVTLTREFGSAPLVAAVDARWLVAAISELVANALRFARSAVRVSLSKDAATLTILIEDDGPGFPQGFDIDGPYRERQGVQGLGLSLAVAADVATMHEGTVSIGQSSLPPFRGGPPGAAVSFTVRQS